MGRKDISANNMKQAVRLQLLVDCPAHLNPSGSDRCEVALTWVHSLTRGRETTVMPAALAASMMRACSLGGCMARELHTRHRSGPFSTELIPHERLWLLVSS